MTETAEPPREGTCRRCRRRLPLFRYDCQHWQYPIGFISSHDEWLCTRCWSDFKQDAEDGWKPCEGLAPVAADWSPWMCARRTELEKALAYGPIGPIITSAPPKES